ncbi:endo-1,4-beta-xylanase [Chondrocystis sp. NIES-4102]|nr:endo-1,4-beta-xylanase [Chondrocystis sp. NIES-4102]
MVRKYKRINRRYFFIALAVLTGLAAILKTGKLKFGKPPISGVEELEKLDKFAVDETIPLSDRAAAKGLLYGAFPQASYPEFSQDFPFQSQFVRECRVFVAGFYWNWGGVRPTEKTYNFAATDYFANFAKENEMLLRGHPLIWYRTTPDWLIDKFIDPATTSKQIKNILIEHIKTVVTRYAGRIHSWDVVNEAINVADGDPYGLRDTKISGINDLKCPSWLDFLGIDFIDLAFQTASQADPQAMLVYNEFGLDYDYPDDEAKRNATLRLLRRLKAQGTPIDALGIQAHLDASRSDQFSPEKLRQFLKDVADLGLKIIISELDVRDRAIKGDIASRDRAVAQAYYDYLTVALEEPAVIAVTTWGLSDRYSWVQKSPRYDGSPQRPLPLDDQLRRKLAWHAIAHAFDNAPQR